MLATASPSEASKAITGCLSTPYEYTLFEQTRHPLRGVLGTASLFALHLEAIRREFVTTCVAALLGVYEVKNPVRSLVLTLLAFPVNFPLRVYSETTTYTSNGTRARRKEESTEEQYQTIFDCARS